MPYRPLQPCRYPNCGKLVARGYCDDHRRDTERQVDQHRGSAASRGYDHKWRRAAKGFLRRNPLCRRCKERDVMTAAKQVDHIIPHKGDMKLFWDKTNWQSRCDPCHPSKTAREDGRWSRRRYS